MHQNKSGLGLCPRTHWGSLHCSPSTQYLNYNLSALWASVDYACWFANVGMYASVVCENVQCGGKNIRFVVMNNLLPSSIRYHEKYDLKGSTNKRRASRAERAKSSPTLKDLDFIANHPDGIMLEADTFTALMKTIERDCRVCICFDFYYKCRKKLTRCRSKVRPFGERLKLRFCHLTGRVRSPRLRPYFPNWTLIM